MSGGGGAGGVFDGVIERLGELGARILFAAAILLVCVLVGRLLRPLVRARLRRRGRPSFTRVFTALYGVVVGAVGFLVAMTAAFPSVEVADVLAGLGIVSVAVGFAFKDVLENLLAGVLLLLRDPFQSGDQIVVAGHEGVVEGVTVRETLLRTPDGRRVLIPNATVYTSPLEVQTHFAKVRSSFTVGIAPGSDVERATAIARDALHAVPGVAPDPPAEVLAVSWTAESVELQCRFWTGAYSRERTAALDGAVRAVHRAFVATGVPLPTDHLLVEMADGTSAPTPEPDPRGQVPEAPADRPPSGDQ